MTTRLIFCLLFPVLIVAQDLDISENGRLFNNPVCGILNQGDSLIICTTNFEYANDGTSVDYSFTLIKSPINGDGNYTVNSPLGLPLVQISMIPIDDEAFFITGVKEGNIASDSIWIGKYNKNLELIVQVFIGQETPNRNLNILLLNGKTNNENLHLFGVSRENNTFPFIDCIIPIDLIGIDSTFHYREHYFNVPQYIIDILCVDENTIIDDYNTYLLNNQENQYEAINNPLFYDIHYPMVFQEINPNLFVAFGQIVSFTINRGAIVKTFDADLNTIAKDTLYPTTDLSKLVYPARSGIALNEDNNFAVSGTKDITLINSEQFPRFSTPSDIFINLYNPSLVNLTDTLLPFNLFTYLDGLLFIDNNNILIYGLYYNGEDIKGFYDIVTMDYTVNSTYNTYTKDNVTIFPNPARNSIYLQKNKQENFNTEKLLLYDSKGKQHILKKNSEYSYDITHLKPGKYNILSKSNNNAINFIGSFIKI